jgi:hypothetical protein
MNTVQTVTLSWQSNCSASRSISLSHALHWHPVICLARTSPPTPPSQSRLRLRLESLRKAPHIPLNWSTVSQELHIRPIDQQLARSALLLVLIPTQRGETPVLADDDLLAAREFVLGTAEGFDGCCAVLGVRSVSAYFPQEKH